MHFLETAFANIVARPRNQRAIRVSNLFARLFMHIAFSGGGVEEDQVFRKRFGLGGYFSVRRQRNARTIENEAVVSSYLIHVDHRPFVGQSNGAQHLETQRALVERIGGPGEIQQHRTSLPDNFADRVAFVKLLGPEILVVPDVFADGDAQLLAVQAKHVLAIRRLEVTRFIEHVISGQQHFALLKNHPPTANQRGFVRNGLPCSIFHPSRIAHN